MIVRSGFQWIWREGHRTPIEEVATEKLRRAEIELAPLAQDSVAFGMLCAVQDELAIRSRVDGKGH